MEELIFILYLFDLEIPLYKLILYIYLYINYLKKKHSIYMYTYKKPAFLFLYKNGKILIARHSSSNKDVHFTIQYIDDSNISYRTMAMELCTTSPKNIFVYLIYFHFQFF